MSFGAAQDVRERVRQAVDIAELVGSYLPLRRQGRNFVGLCPWHDDARPSLQVNPTRQSWKCWVCDVGGDIFSFVMRREGVSFPEALEMLAERAGIRWQPSAGAARVEPGSPGDVRTLYRALAWAEQQYLEFLSGGAPAAAARQYLAERGIAGASLEQFRLGCAPEGWDWLVTRARGAGFSREVLAAVGLVSTSAGGRVYDTFRGRLMFPIRDAQGRPVAFGGRVLPGDSSPAKYINSPETRLFKKSEQLYGLDVARTAIQRRRQAVVVEGYTDVIMAHQHGLDNTVAVLGTSMTAGHVRQLRALADTIVLVLDGDEAGRRRTNELLDLFVASEVDLRVLTLPGGADPCDFLAQHGLEPLDEMIAAAPDALEYKMLVETAGIDPVTQTHPAHQALERVLETIAKAPRLALSDAARQLREEQMLTRLARQFRVPATQIRSRLAELRRAAPRRPATSAGGPPSRRLIDELPAREAELLEILLVHPELAGEALAAVPREALASSAARALLEACAGLQDLGQPCDFQRVMLHLEDPRLKSLLVELDEGAAEKAQRAPLDPAERLESLVSRFRRRTMEDQCQRTLAALEQVRADGSTETQMLLELQEKLRQRHGITAPTDGLHAGPQSQVADPHWGAGHDGSIDPSDRRMDARGK